jgi:carbon-monoxide dehydrogenase medium subunit
MPSYPAPFRIAQPGTVADARDLVTSDPEAILYAGGTELLLAMKHGGLRYGTLVDLKCIPGLGDIEVRGDRIVIGALATHHAIARSPLVRERLPEFARLESQIANPRVRATGTLGGNLAFAEPHSDPATLLTALDSEIVVEGRGANRVVPVSEFLVGAYETSLSYRGPHTGHQGAPTSRLSQGPIA